MDELKNARLFFKKWLLFGFTLLAIISSIVLASVASIIVDSMAKSNSSVYTENVKSYFKNMIIALAVISASFNLLGLVAVYKQHISITMTYAVLMTLSSFVGISLAIKTPIYWYPTVLSFIIAVLSYKLAIEVAVLRNRMSATTQPQTVAQIAPDYSDQRYSSPPEG